MDKMDFDLSGRISVYDDDLEALSRLHIDCGGFSFCCGAACVSIHVY